MAGKFHHELIYHGADVAAKLASARITLCGAGALGSNLAETLARQGFGNLRVIDKDRVEEHNLGTQTYCEGDIGAWKAEVLRGHLFRAVGVEIEAFNKELTERTASRFLKDSSVVLDLFDNSASRRLVQEHCRAANLPCLHAGLFADYGEVIWNERYRVPLEGAGDVCDYPLARNLILLTVAVTAETLLRFVATGAQEDFSLTLRDFAIRSMSPTGGR